MTRMVIDQDIAMRSVILGKSNCG